MISGQSNNGTTESRVVKISGTTLGKSTVLYWMNRDQRLQDNSALSFAQSVAIEREQPLIVFFGLDLSLNKYNDRQLMFMVQGLQEIEQSISKFQIPIIIQKGKLIPAINKIIKSYNIDCVITDFSPLKQDQDLVNRLSKNKSIELFEVDSHNIVPCRTASDKREYAAYTIRPKINKYLTQFTDSEETLIKHPFQLNQEVEKVNWDLFKNTICKGKGENVLPAGEKAALKHLDDFIKNKLYKYSLNRNDPTKDYQSGLSPYLHFGQISSRSIVRRLQSENLPLEIIEDFIEELVIRKELSDNFCFYTHNYDSFDCFPDWSRKTLTEHQPDPRIYLYTLQQLENAETHDALWNASQNEMITTGKMHGYMRMYWAKKILEWTATPQIALEYAIYLNDKYQLDGHDPNGYAGIAWSIGGVHDRPWFEREIFGKVRYMSYNGCKRKFDIDKYITQNTIHKT